MSLYGPGLTSTPKDRVKKAYSNAVALPPRLSLQPHLGWSIKAGGLILGYGANASRAWEDAAKKLPR